MPIQYNDDLLIYTKGEENNNVLITSNDIDFLHEEKVVYTIKAPVAVDAKGDSLKCEYVYSDIDTDMLTLRCPSDWLDTAAYPVKIDPIITTYTLKSGDATANNDQFGNAVAVGDFNGDNYADALVGAWQNDVNGTDTGRAYIFFGPLNSDDDTPDVIIAPIDGAVSKFYGYSVAAGDFNNDGYDDAVVSCINDDLAIVYGSKSMSSTYYENDIDVRVPPPGSIPAGLNNWGTAVAAGDFNTGTDSYDDLLVSATLTNNNGDNGEVYLYYYDSTDWGDGTVGDSPDDTLQSDDLTDEGAEFGKTVSVGNFYSGTNDDIAVGEPKYEPANNRERGRVNLFDGDAIDDDGATPNQVSDAGIGHTIDNPVQTAASEDDEFGFSVAVADLNPSATTNDFDDVIVGEPRYDESATDGGRVYIYTCDDNVAGWQTDRDDITGADGTVDNPEGASGAGDNFGHAVGAGDFYMDGVADFFIGAPASDYGGSNRGTVYIYDCDGSTIPTAFTDSQNGTQDLERLGSSIAGGKYSNDMYYYLLSGAIYWDNATLNDIGRVLVIVIPEFSDYGMPGVFTIMMGTAVIWRRKKKKRN
jgi:hypothetical protein